MKRSPEGTETQRKRERKNLAGPVSAEPMGMDTVEIP
jgi:hypothetical protein